MEHSVWFQLVDEEGKAATSADFVNCAGDANVAQVRKAVKNEYSDSYLDGIPASDLVVFANREAYEAKKRDLSKLSSSLTGLVKDVATGALAGNTLIGSLGGSMEDALIVQVPTYRQVGIVRKERELEEEKTFTKKARVEDNDLSIFATDLMSAIHECNLDAIFAIESVVELPFPSLLTQPNRFQVNERGFFTYQARSELKPLYDKVVSRWLNQRTITVNVAGTIGYGKSHMLAVLVLLLLKNPIKSRFESVPFVCYIPDCRELLAGEDAVVAIMKKNILLNMPGFIGPMDTITDVRAVLRGQKVILVADQWNSIDDRDTRCQAARKHLASCMGTSVFVKIHGMSMDAKTYRALLPQQTSADNNIYHGGFNADEFSTWLHHHPAIFTQHDDELALLTGKVPLYTPNHNQRYHQRFATSPTAAGRCCTYPACLAFPFLRQHSLPRFGPTASCSLSRCRTNAPQAAQEAPQAIHAIRKARSDSFHNYTRSRPARQAVGCEPVWALS